MARLVRLGRDLCICFGYFINQSAREDDNFGNYVPCCSPLNKR
jgi:hypothetical protein